MINIVNSSSGLQDRWTNLKKANPALRIRDAATALGCSEAELLATTVGDTAIRLDGDWTKLVTELPKLGRVMSLTRNESCVLEHKGSFQKVAIMGTSSKAMGTVVGPIETRIFFNAWTYGFAVQQATAKGMQKSIQIFDNAGDAITKIYLQPPSGKLSGSNEEVYNNIIEAFKSEDQTPFIEVEKRTEAVTTNVDEVDATSLLSDWTNMRDTHEFFGMLKKHNVSRWDAIKLAEGEFTYTIHAQAIRTLLQNASDMKLPIMIFAGNHGNLQIHQGKINTIRIMDPWLNVLDPDFNMHLREDHIAEAWVVKKPTADGIVTSIELYDASKKMIAQFFGLRKPGIAERDDWRKLVYQLYTLPV